ncbi:MAG: copper amine oxidase N-terminal domain-containing protein [Clostridia bacterium]|nr:copper amine oxidase N-terminal domain-containing protein [Clostridia bacterium]
MIKIHKKMLRVLLALLIILGISLQITFAGADPKSIRVDINGMPVNFDVQLQIINGRLYIPVWYLYGILI